MGRNENTAPPSGLTARRGTAGNKDNRERGLVEDSTELHINEWKCVQAWPFTLKNVLPGSRESFMKELCQLGDLGSALTTLWAPNKAALLLPGSFYLRVTSTDPEASLLDRVRPSRRTRGC